MARTLLYIVIVLLVTGCYLLPDTGVQATRHVVTIASVTPDSSGNATGLPQGVYDALSTSMGICFDAAWDAAGQVFIMRSAEDHIRFYDLADNSDLCRRPVERVPFDFSGGDVLIGTWNRGRGCTAQHIITAYERDDQEKIISIQARFFTDGDCPYDLARGLWLGLVDAQDYVITLDVTP